MINTVKIRKIRNVPGSEGVCLHREENDDDSEQEKRGCHTRREPHGLIG
jgi:hypothetical protein